MRHLGLWASVLVLLTGCQVDNQHWETVEGERYWVGCNRYWKEVLTKDQEEWSYHSGIDLSRYLYYYEGPPVMLHVWWDLNRDGKQECMPIYTTLLVNQARPESIVKAKGAILCSRRVETPPSDKRMGLRLAMSGHHLFGGSVSVRFERAVFHQLNRPEVQGNAMKIGQTYDLDTMVYYTVDHPLYERRKSGEGLDSSMYTADPEPGKTILKMRLRLTPLNLKAKYFISVKKDGDTSRFQQERWITGMILYKTDDQSEIGLQTSDDK